MKKEKNLKIYKDKKVLSTASLYVLNLTLVLLALNFLSNNFAYFNSIFAARYVDPQSSI